MMAKKIQIDVSDIKAGVQMLYGIEPCEETFTFFYDESGNCRKFSLTEKGVNSADALKGDFVLAGVAFEGLSKNIDIGGLHQALHFMEGQKELKFRHLFNDSPDFLSFMESRRATDFLRWLKNSDLLIHYTALNNLYYALVDIVDSLWENNYLELAPIWDLIKSALYDFTCEHTDEIIGILYRFGYPNITDCQGFCHALCDCISCNNVFENFYPSYCLAHLQRMLNEAAENDELVFIQDNDPFILIREYYLFYLDRCELFTKSRHIFDEEPTVQKQLSKVELIENGKPFCNYEFADSEHNVFIQISDLISGLLRKLFLFLDGISMDETKAFSSTISSLQTANFAMIFDLIKKSDSKNKLFLKNSNAVKNLYDRMEKLRILAGR